MSPHWLGLIGEGLNFCGAFVIALDIFLRQHEHLRERRLERLNAFSKKHLGGKSRHLGVRLDDPEFARKVLDIRAARLAMLGIAFLAIGTVCLLGYHLMGIQHEKSCKNIIFEGINLT